MKDRFGMMKMRGLKRKQHKYTRIVLQQELKPNKEAMKGYSYRYVHRIAPPVALRYFVSHLPKSSTRGGLSEIGS